MRIVRQILLMVVLAAGTVGAAGTSLAAQGTGTIDGHVISPNGAPVIGATIVVAGQELTTRSAEEGHFTIRRVPEGTHTVRVLRLGFQMSEFQVTVVAGQIASLEATLVMAIVTLDTARIKGALEKPARLAYTTKYDEFYGRRKTGGGKYFTHDEIEEKGVASVAELVRGVAGMTVRRVGNHFELNVAGCPQANFEVFIDGVKAYPRPGDTAGPSGTATPDQPFLGNIRARDQQTNVQSRLTPIDVLADFSPDQIEAIEIYTGSAGLPAVARGDGCAAIFLWTR